MAIDEGYVKYHCHWLPAEALDKQRIEELNHWRNKLYQLGLIGQYENGIGYGNISIRGEIDRQFTISGTSTGGIPVLNESYYTTVIDYDWTQNTVTCQGPIQSSSEALTHAAIYEANPNIHAVIHIHDRSLWSSLMNQVPTTRENVAYGTPEMAEEIIRLCQEDTLVEQQILVMSGHEEGIIVFGVNLDRAGNLLLRYHAGQEEKVR
jgi:L-ribulose-5-phosphate 4-epimerase